MENRENQKTSLGELGEFGLIEHLTQSIKLQQPSSKLGVGDDAAILDFGDHETLVSSDILIEGVHFNLAYTPLKHLGYKAVMVNLSDIYAMNGEPTQIVVSLAVSNRFPVEAVDELYKGILLAAKNYNVDLVGGDTTSSTSGLIINITVLGQVKKGEAVQRDGAKPNDLLVVSGDLGGAYLGLQILERENKVFKVNPDVQPDLASYSYILERQLKPEARKDIVDLLKKLEVKPTAMIDVSDGLSSEVIHLCKNSKVGMNIFEDKLPIDPTAISVCEELNLDSTTVLLNGGEDYELLFTIDQKDYDKIKGNPNLTVIGHAKPENEGMHLITRANQQVALIARGWNHMNKEEE